MKLNELTITKAHEGLRKKEFSAFELCQAYLDEIEEKDKEISAFLTVAKELAISQAKKADKMIAQRRDIKFLTGIPLAVKDNILIEGIKCTAGSKMLADYTAPYDATVVKKLKEQGAIMLGKTNLDEFAMGASTENSAFGPTRNPHDQGRVPGGSSGGSAAAVAADLCCYALGSDTAGSIRQPASFCGVVGLKPTYGAISRYGLIAFASSLDQIGPLTKNIEDCRIVFEAIKGKDEMDSTSVNAPRFNNWNLIIKDLRIGVPKEYFIKGISPGVEQIIKEAIRKYEGAGARVQEISLPHTEYALPSYYIIAPSETSANLARYDAIRYGEIPKSSGAKSKIKNLFDYYLKARGEGFGDEVRRRIILGTFALSAGYYEAYYLRAQKVRTRIKEDFNKALEKVDVIFTPVSPTPAFKLGEKTNDPLVMYLCDVFTAAVNLAGLPALSFPVGEIKGLPVGLQIIGKSFEEDKILSIGEFFEK